MTMQQPQIPRPQFTPDQYHDLVAFQTFQLMQAQLALSVRERDLLAVAQQCADLCKDRDEWKSRAELAQQAVSDLSARLSE